MASNVETDAPMELQPFEPEPPTYDNAFPALAGDSRPNVPTIAVDWQPKFQFRQSKCTQVFNVPREERKYKDASERTFGDDHNQMKICKDIMQKHGVSIELSLSKDQSMTVVINGRSDAVMAARQKVVSALQTQATVILNIPQEYHRFILGKKGKTLQDIVMATSTKVFLPRTDEKNNPDEIRIVGAKEGVAQAKHKIEVIYEEQSKLAFERLPIPKIYHPFVCGPNRSNVLRLSEETGAKIIVPPKEDHIFVSGEKEGVMSCKKTLMAIFEEKQRKCQTVSVEVSKSQHKYVVGPKYVNVQEILARTGVSVEVPDLDSPSETITLRGEQEKLGMALTDVYAKANSVTFADVSAPAWLHRFIIGQKGVNIKKITENFPTLHIELTESQDKITIEGPPNEVEKAVEKLTATVKELKERMDYAEIQIDQKFHKHIIGKAGSNIKTIKQETGVTIRVPPDNVTSNVIRIEGDPKGVKTAKEQLMEMAQRMENEKSRDVIIEQRFHKQIIGAKGETIREIRDKFNQVQITFPDVGKKTDVVTLRGPKKDVDSAYKHLTTLAKELTESNYQAQVKIFKDFHKNIIGKGGSNIKKIREETDTKIDLPSENSDSDLITITGKKANVEQAQIKIEAIQKELGNIKEIVVNIPQNLHNTMIGSGGHLIKSISNECGGVIIRFPKEGSKSEKVTIRGPSADVENAKIQLLESATAKKESSFTEEIEVNPQYHKFLIGKGGSNIKKVREKTGARLIVPGKDDKDQSTILIVGKEEGVKVAKAELVELVKSLENIVEGELDVDPKHHRHFVARRGEVLRQIGEDYGGVTVSFPRSGVNSTRVVIKGAKDCVEGATKKIQEIVNDLESQVTVECIIPQADHRTVMGPGGNNVREITKVHEVGIKFPDRPVPNGTPKEEPVVNGDSIPEETGPKKIDIIIITGQPKNCENAKQALFALVPVTEEISIPFDFHRFIIGQKGNDVRHLMQTFDVNISIPPADQNSDIVKVKGPPSNVERAKEALMLKVEELEGQAEDRKLKSFPVSVDVDEKYHPKIIGRKGKDITILRKKYDVNIKFPDKGSENQSTIIITGYEKDANAARDEILSIVEGFENMYVAEVEIDHRVHPRIIGSRGRGINQLMEKFGVDVRFPRSGDTNPDLVVISGVEDNVEDCRDELLNMVEEFMQDAEHSEYMKTLQRPSRENGESHNRRSDDNPMGFVVKDAPWNRAPDTESQDDFPAFGAIVNPKGRSWGPMRK